MTFLVDANVLSEPTRPTPDPRVLAWLRAQELNLVVNPMSLGEIEYGILLLPTGRRRKRLERWFAAGVERLTVLDFDRATGSRRARLMADLRRKGRSIPIKESLIAATSLVHGLTVATRYTQDFVPAGVRIFNPFTS
ncbi:MAG: PIN domain-containing protein [Verrucomicrobiales bacterium]|nr:PIN domain-containing protein [Verrucomicrobiales bacterium]